MHVWFYFKKHVLDYYPKLETIGSGEDAIKALAKALIEACNALPNSLFLFLAKSMLERVKALYKAKGWHIKY